MTSCHFVSCALQVRARSETLTHGSPSRKVCMEFGEQARGLAWNLWCTVGMSNERAYTWNFGRQGSRERQKEFLRIAPGDLAHVASILSQVRSGVVGFSADMWPIRRLAKREDSWDGRCVCGSATFKSTGDAWKRNPFRTWLTVTLQSRLGTVMQHQKMRKRVGLRSNPANLLQNQRWQIS